MYRKLKDISDSELNEEIERFKEKIKDLKFQEFMANTYTEKGIIREDIIKLEDAIYNYNWTLKERQWEIEDKIKTENKCTI